MKFVCKSCGIVISEPLKKLQDMTLLNDKEDGAEYIPQGFYHIYDEEVVMRLKKTKYFYLVNVKDLINIQNHSNYGRLNGCCGLDGLDGMNKVCVNDHEIGTEFSDCWTLHYVELDTDTVEIVE